MPRPRRSRRRASRNRRRRRAGQRRGRRAARSSRPRTARRGTARRQAPAGVGSRPRARRPSRACANGLVDCGRRGPGRFPKPAEHGCADQEGPGVHRKRPAEPDVHGEQRRDRCDGDLCGDCRGPDAAVGGDELVVVHHGRQERLGCRGEEHLPDCQAEGDRVGDRSVVVPHGQDCREQHPHDVGRHHHPDAREPVDEAAGERREQQHREDLGQDCAGDADGGAGERDEQQRKSGELCNVAHLADRSREPQPAVGGPGKQTAKPWPPGRRHVYLAFSRGLMRLTVPRSVKTGSGSGSLSRARRPLCRYAPLGTRHRPFRPAPAVAANAGGWLSWGRRRECSSAGCARSGLGGGPPAADRVTG